MLQFSLVVVFSMIVSINFFEAGQGTVRRKWPVGVSRDSADERQVRIKLTEAGRKLHLQASDIVQRVRHATGLQNKQVEQLLEDVGALREALDRHTTW
jgi:hypothetical protein